MWSSTMRARQSCCGEETNICMCDVIMLPNVLCTTSLSNNVCVVGVYREYKREGATIRATTPFQTWLRCRCALMHSRGENIEEDLMALSWPPSRKACSFRGMTSFGSHYRVKLEEAGVQHVTFDSGVAELSAQMGHTNFANNGVVVELVRVGILKDIIVLTYANLNLVLMVVSWVPKHTELRPTLCRDVHGFWLANMAALPRDTTDPYLLPALASQVGGSIHTLFLLL